MHRLAVIGTNFVTDWLIDAAREVENVTVAAVLSRDCEHGRAYADAHDIPDVCTTLDALCEDRTIDCVYIASPNLLHVPQAVRLLEAGKHVLCEKPLAPDLSRFDEAVRTARKHDRVLMEAMVLAHLPCWKQIRETAAQIGPIRRALFTFCQYSSRYDKFKAGIVENAFNPCLCNGALMDLGVYCLHAAQLTFGTPTDIRAAAYRIPGSIDGAGSIILTYADGIADIQYSKISQGLNASELQGERGSLLIDSLTRPKTWTLVPRTGKRSDGVAVQTAGGDPRTLDVTPPRHPMAYELEEFLAQVDGARTERYLDDTRAVIAVMDAARMQTGIDFTA